MQSSEESIASLIEGSQKLTNIFGYWPTFHDAEVLDVHLWREDVKPEEKRYICPVLTTKLHVWELTNEVDPQGYFVLRKNTLTTLRFQDVLDLRVEGFNHQNAILGLSIVRNQNPEGFDVHFDPAFGMGAAFTCSRIEVVDVVPYGGSAQPPNISG